MGKQQRTQWGLAVAGGGLAGLSLALQVKRARPDLDIVVVDRQSRPAPEGGFKVGESVVEVGSHYLREVLGLGTHLLEQQLPKFGLRFFSGGRAADVTTRLEYGPFEVGQADGEFLGLPVPTYNLDRGRLENLLASRCRDAGVELIDGAKVSAVNLTRRSDNVRGRPEGRRHSFTVGGTSMTARWFVDATGVAAATARRLELLEFAPHETHAAWFHVDTRVDPETWSEDEAWSSRTAPGLRWLSTNHLVGRGYWIWVIPLVSGATSVGIVTHGDFHAPAQTNRLDRALRFLDAHEPLLARSLGDQPPRGFHVRRMRAYRAAKIASADRWAIVGEAGAFLDPLYSPGCDFIAIGNCLVSDLIIADAAGRDIRAPTRFANLIHEKTYARYLSLYQGQYPVLGSPQALAVKVAWDTSIYFGFNVQLFRNGRLTDARFLSSFGRDIARLDRLQAQMQGFLAQVAAADEQRHPTHVDQVTLEFVHDPYLWSVDAADDATLRRRVSAHVTRLERVLSGLQAAAEGAAHRAHPEVRADVERLWNRGGNR